MKNIITVFSKTTMILTTVFICFIANAQKKNNYTVAIFLYNNVELLDFAGPGEVFSATPGFKVYTVSADGNEVLSQNFVKVKPEYSISNAPKPDIIVFPGGNALKSSQDPKVIQWVKDHVAAGNITMSVCTGARILAKADLLNNLNVTTHHGFIPGLQQMLPSSKVLPDTRFVDNGNVITTAGVSAGIDGALHLVSRIKGADVAAEVAWYMEYEKWNPDEGRQDYQNSYFNQAKFQSANDNKTLVSQASADVTDIPYVGELKNFATQLQEKGLYKQEELLLKDALKWYPDEQALYNNLSYVYQHTGRNAPPDEQSFINMIKDGKIDEALKIYEQSKADFKGWKIFSEKRMNDLGYTFMQKKDYQTAIKIFKLNAEAYPESFNVYDSLGEGLLAAGNNKEALKNYQRSLELNPQNTNAAEVIKTIPVQN